MTKAKVDTGQWVSYCVNTHCHLTNISQCRILQVKGSGSGHLEDIYTTLGSLLGLAGQTGLTQDILKVESLRIGKILGSRAEQNILRIFDHIENFFQKCDIKK